MITPACTSRNAELNGLLLFQPAYVIWNVFVLLSLLAMVVSVKSKYTAVGRVEFATFLYVFILSTVVDVLLVSNIVPMANRDVFVYGVAVHVGLTMSQFWCLLFNALMPFHFVQDGVKSTLWTLRLSCLAIGLLTGALCALTANSLVGLSAAQPLLLFIVVTALPSLCAVLYFVLGIVYVVRSHATKWPIGDLVLAALFFVVGQVIHLTLNTNICEYTMHYIDGTFLQSLCTFLSVMMVYKYWDSITKDNLESSFSFKGTEWTLDTPALLT
jgi:hypothetical protein